MFETATNSDRTVNAKAGFVLAAVIGLAILSVWNLILMLAQRGRAPRPSLALAVAAIFCAVGIFHFRAMPLRLAFAMAGTQAAVRVALWLAGAPRGLQRVAALGGEMLTTLAAIIAIFVIVKWLNSAGHQRRPSDRENPTS
jgi:flagellar biogenesis protein FliO